MPSVPLISSDLTWWLAAWSITVEKCQSLAFWPLWSDCHVNQNTRPSTTTSAK